MRSLAVRTSSASFLKSSAGTSNENLVPSFTVMTCRPFSSRLILPRGSAGSPPSQWRSGHRPGRQCRDHKTALADADTRLLRLYQLIQDGDIAANGALKTRIAGERQTRKGPADDRIRRRAMRHGETGAELLMRFRQLMPMTPASTDANRYRNAIATRIDAIVMQGMTMLILGWPHSFELAPEATRMA